MLIQVSQFTLTFWRRNVIYSMSLLFPHRLAQLQPPTIRFVNFSTCVPATATWTVMFDFHIILSLFESHSHFLSPEYISIKILTEYLCCFVIDLILGIDHNAIFGTSLIKYSSYDLRMTWIYEDQQRHWILSTLKYLPNFICWYWT